MIAACPHEILSAGDLAQIFDREARLAREESLFGPDTSVREQKTARAEAAGREDFAMTNVQQGALTRQSGLPLEARIVRASDPTDSARRLFEGLACRYAQSGPFSELVEVTPALARIILERNPNNRKLKTQQVETVARDIREGRWETNGETIIISRDGELNDGQHRLYACIEADTPIVTFIAFGMERESRRTIDSNQTTRTPGDFLSMAGIEDGNSIAAIAAYLWQIEKFGEIPKSHTHPSKRPTKQQIQEYVERKGVSIALAARVTSSTKAGRLYSKSLIAVVLHHIRDAFGVHVEGDEPEAFIRSFLTGDNLSSDDPVMVVRNRLMDDKRKHRSDPRVAMELIVRAWNLRCRRQTIAKCVSNGELPAVETFVRSR